MNNLPAIPLIKVSLYIDSATMAKMLGLFKYDNIYEMKDAILALVYSTSFVVDKKAVALTLRAKEQT